MCVQLVRGNGPIKLRESGMPYEKAWTRFFAPTRALRLLGLSKNTLDVVDFGCGYGTFTIPAARIVRGKVFASDIEPEMRNIVEKKAKRNNIEPRCANPSRFHVRRIRT
jgi:SAM-dependent methyltransferase